MPGGDGVRGHAAVDSRPRQPGRVLVLAAGSQRRLDRVPRRSSCRSSSPRRASGPSWPASPRRSRATVPQVFADVDRDKVLQAGRRARRRLPDDAGVSRRAVREPVQPLRPAVARVPAGGRRGARDARAASAQFYVRNDDGADGAAVGAADDAAGRSARSTPTASTSIARRRSPARRRPATARARRSTRSRRWRGRRCRARSATTGRTCRTRSSKAVGHDRHGCSRCRSSSSS